LIEVMAMSIYHRLAMLGLVVLLLAGGCNYRQPAPSEEKATASAPEALPYSVSAPMIQRGGSQQEVAAEPAAVEQAAVPVTEQAAAGATLDPYVQVSPETIEVAAGQVFTITAVPVLIGLPLYEVSARDEGVQDAPPMAKITYENQMLAMDATTSTIIEFVSASASGDRLVVTLRAKAAGVTTLMITASGEIHFADGSATMMGAGSGTALVVVK
jgi:hypothetical protein